MRFFISIIFVLSGYMMTSCLPPANECELYESKCDGKILLYCALDEINTYWDEEDCSIYKELCTVEPSGDAYCFVSESACLNQGDQVCTWEGNVGECVKDGDYFIVQAVTECVKPEICQIDDNGKGYCAVPAE